MKVIDFSISGPKLIELTCHGDPRGFFVERFRVDRFRELKLPCEFVQENFSRSAVHILRGLHYQWNMPQGKLVTTTRGRIFDVAVDIRARSPTFGKHISVEIDGDRPAWFWIPAGFAHGFCVLSPEGADVLYKVDNYYNPQGESGILWSDKDLGVQWPIKEPILSQKDTAAKTFNDYRKSPQF